MKIYRVEVIFETVVNAASEVDAQRHALDAIRYEDDEPIRSTPIHMLTLATLPQGWDANCRPWGERDPMDRTIGEILGSTTESNL